MKIPEFVKQEIKSDDRNTFIVSDGGILYENFLGEGIKAHKGKDFSSMSDDEITDYIIDSVQD